MDELLNSELTDQPLMHGVINALVTDNKDPKNLARVKVRYPLLNNTLESDWIRIACLMSGKDRGSYFLPEVGDEVLVAFQFGDINTPYIIGALYNGVDTPPQNNQDGENNIREIKSRSGHVIRFDDKSSAEKIEIIDKTTNNKIVITSNDNTISISSDKDIKLEAPKGTASINAKDIALNGTSSISLKGGQIKLNADTSLTMESGATTEMKAGATVTIKGVTINLN
ncbi:hypothetical protein BTA51_09345 [Hahella sp. CCB-MM4]|uniref:phage baseplate assembly protein V n=1 Tax=Hahella sp. (strain CCB-MM4) TaxID=1926491 RepID=UPI000B9BFC90|nr:phage baseplate assembly protein V [Hahella sp. CCB-MM4]OZG73974.1 hypothetical protein BTA51_09345 [Hahella sp. CCB-MM4]